MNAATKLICVECGAVSSDGAGWKAALVARSWRRRTAEVVLYCPECWLREFDDATS